MSTLLLPEALTTLASASGTLSNNDFKLIKTLGQGSFGKVYQVKHTPTGENYAIKVVNKDRVKNPSMLKQIKNEISIMQSINHPYIVRLVTYFENDTNINLVLELGGVGFL